MRRRCEAGRQRRRAQASRRNGRRRFQRRHIVAAHREVRGGLAGEEDIEGAIAAVFGDEADVVVLDPDVSVR